MAWYKDKFPLSIQVKTSSNIYKIAKTKINEFLLFINELNISLIIKKLYISSVIYTSAICTYISCREDLGHKLIPKI